jgi:nitroimidazol reductase NimA-like FMN-containing flavoprotein (pyridoxamine 5'-phosphate oxidase superfamily)
MLIQEMTKAESLALLARNRLGRLACSREGQPYITPINFTLDGDCLYGFSTVGQKIEWMRTNPLVCIETDELESSNRWATVIVLGRYEELPNTPECENARQIANALLQRQPVWWEPGYAQVIQDGRECASDLVHFRIHIARISGRRATQDSEPAT